MWRLAKSIETLRLECNQRWPRRDKASDGTIGDPSHASRTSDHNPWVKDASGTGVVRAFDCDGGPGLEPDEAHDDIGDTVAAAVIAAAKSGHPAMGEGAYVIWQGRIASAKSVPAWSWRPYSGADPHRSHVHVSVAEAQRGYDSTRPWGIAKPVPPPRPAQVVVKQGEGLGELAGRLGVTIPQILWANPRRFGLPLKAGESLNRPEGKR